MGLTSGKNLESTPAGLATSRAGVVAKAALETVKLLARLPPTVGDGLAAPATAPTTITRRVFTRWVARRFFSPGMHKWQN